MNYRNFPTSWYFSSSQQYDKNTLSLKTCINPRPPNPVNISIITRHWTSIKYSHMLHICIFGETVKYCYEKKKPLAFGACLPRKIQVPGCFDAGINIQSICNEWITNSFGINMCTNIMLTPSNGNTPAKYDDQDQSSRNCPKMEPPCN